MIIYTETELKFIMLLEEDVSSYTNVGLRRKISLKKFALLGNDAI